MAMGLLYGIGFYDIGNDLPEMALFYPFAMMKVLESRRNLYDYRILVCQDGYLQATVGIYWECIIF